MDLNKVGITLSKVDIINLSKWPFPHSERGAGGALIYRGPATTEPNLGVTAIA